MIMFTPTFSIGFLERMIWDFVKQKAQSLLGQSVEAVQKRFIGWFNKFYGDDKKRRDYMVCYAKHQLEFHARIASYEYISAKVALRSDDEIQRAKEKAEILSIESEAFQWGKLNTEALIEFSLSIEGQKIIANIEEITRCTVGLHELFQSDVYRNNKEITAKFFRKTMFEKCKSDILALMQAEQNQRDTSELEEFKIFAKSHNYRVFDTGISGYLQGLADDELEALQAWMNGDDCVNDISRHLNISDNMDSDLHRSDAECHCKRSEESQASKEEMFHCVQHDKMIDSSFPTECNEEQGISGVLYSQDSLPNFLAKIYGNDENDINGASRHNERAKRGYPVKTRRVLFLLMINLDCHASLAMTKISLYKPPPTHKRKIQKNAPFSQGIFVS